jgi:hypothetical protein
MEPKAARAKQPYAEMIPGKKFGAMGRIALTYSSLFQDDLV